MENEVYFVRNSWCYVKKTVNFNNFTISYTEADGFRSEEAARQAKSRDDADYEADLKRIKEIANIKYTFKEYVEYWLTSIFIKNTDTCTKTIGVWAVRNLIEPNIQQDILISYITPDYINDIIKRCIPICESAGETVRKYLRKLLKDAFAYGLIRKDIRDSLIDVETRAPKLKLLTTQELKQMLQEASKHPGYYFEILLGLFAGLRSGEIRGLRYEDFDVEKHTIRVARQYTSNYCLSDNNGQFEYSCYMEEKEPKASSYRILHVAGFLFEELEKKRAFNEKIIKNREAQGKTVEDTEYICLSPYGQRKKKTTLLASLKMTCHKAHVPAITFHALRHMFATMLLEKGVPLEEISKLMGHKSVLTTFNTYCGVMDATADARKAVSQMVPVLEGGSES